MKSRSRDTLLIPYGRAKFAPGNSGGPAVTVRRFVPLRLSDGPYPFPEPPDLVRIVGTAERLELLREHLQALCGVWDQPARLFLDAYFRWIDGAIAAGAAELGARGGGLFVPADWSFSALRPLPQAQLASDLAQPVRADFAFWTGDAMVAIELKAGASPRRQRQDELACLAAANVTVIKVPGAALQQDGERLFARLLPAPFQRFWERVILPASSFGPQLDEIRVAD